MPFGIDCVLRPRGAVVAEHADEGGGALGGGEGDAGGDEGGEDVRVEFERVGDCGGGFLQQGAGEVPGGLEGGAEGAGAVGGGFDGQDGFFVGDLREAFFACGGVGCFVGGGGGEGEELAGLGEEVCVCFYHAGVVGEG